MIIVGNKLDLEREVSEDEANVLAAKYKTEYYETSAVNGICVEEAFELLATKYVHTINKQMPNNDNKGIDIDSNKNEQNNDGECC